jgi:nucleotide-binding universal stress UspA family protein
MTHRILVAVDLSDASIAALRAARALAVTRNATLAVVHVVAGVADVRPFFPQSYGINAIDTVELERLAAEALERRVAEVEGGAGAERFIEIGAPYAEIVRRAEAWKADLVVVGSHGKTGVSRALLGSVAEHVARVAHCPVLVSRPGRGSGLVMAATDLSDPSLPAIARASEEARLQGARLVVVHASETPLASYGAAAAALLGNVAPALTAEQEQERRAALVTVLQGAMGRFGAQGEALVVDGDAVAGVVGAIEARQPDLLVVGTHGRTGISRLLLGSVAEKLVRLADCSVLVVRQTA